MKIDVVYKLGIGSKFDDLELRYSLRSLSNFKDLGQVWIVGYKPAWCQNVKYIKQGDFLPSCKDGNLINKLIRVCQEESLSTEFLNFSDDQLLLRECSYDDFTTPYYDNSLIQFEVDKRLNKWKTRLRNTILNLQERGFSSNCYESHIPTLINKFDFEGTIKQFNYAFGQGMCGNTLYFNCKLAKDTRPLPQNFAVKIEEEIQDQNTLVDLCDGRLHLNFAEIATNSTLFSFLEGKFPNKSKYEL